MRRPMSVAMYKSDSAKSGFTHRISLTPLRFAGSEISDNLYLTIRSSRGADSYSKITPYSVKYTCIGALAEELGKGLQNLVRECESRTRLQLFKFYAGEWRNWYTRWT